MFVDFATNDGVVVTEVFEFPDRLSARQRVSLNGKVFEVQECSAHSRQGTIPGINGPRQVWVTRFVVEDVTGVPHLPMPLRSRAVADSIVELVNGGAEVSGG